MMEKIDLSTLGFLRKLKKNNNREWFLQNKKDYTSAKENFEMFVQKLIDELSAFDHILKGLEAKSCIFRLNRDIRFSNDKSPYKTNFGASIVRGGRKNGEKFSGYYVHLEPDGGCFIAGGAYMPSPEWLGDIRAGISENFRVFSGIINEKNFRNYFKEVRGDKLKNPPKGYTADNPAIDYLKYKNYYVMHEVSDSEVLDAAFLKKVLKVSQAMKPFNDFLNNCS
jgi:uncharacterized protein (TIGR02453 family)